MKESDRAKLVGGKYFRFFGGDRSLLPPNDKDNYEEQLG